MRKEKAMENPGWALQWSKNNGNMKSRETGRKCCATAQMMHAGYFDFFTRRGQKPKQVPRDHVEDPYGFMMWARQVTG